MEFADTKALVIGTGISGLSAVSLLERKGAQVILFDANEKLKCADVKAKLKADSQAQIVIGTLPEGLLDTVNLVIPSPGVPMDIPMMLEIRGREIPVWGEIELGYRCGQGSIAAITGTNGKTTTTTLVGQILKNYTYLCGGKYRHAICRCGGRYGAGCYDGSRDQQLYAGEYCRVSSESQCDP